MRLHLMHESMHTFLKINIHGIFNIRLNLKIFNFKKGIGIENATRNQQPSTIEIKRIEKVKDQKSMETRRIEKLKDQKVWKQEGDCNYVDRTVILKHLQSLF